MKLAYIALTAAGIAVIGAISIHGTNRDAAEKAAQPVTASNFDEAYDQILRDPQQAGAGTGAGDANADPGFSGLNEAQAQSDSQDLRNLPASEQGKTGSSDTAASRSAATPAAPADTTPAGPSVDESALRYFAQQGDLERLQAEISRLRALYPNWTPPANPLAVQDNSDDQLQAMWQAYAEGRYQDVRDMIAERQQREPGWVPPADLTDRLFIAETRRNLLAAAKDQDYAKVIDLASQAPSLLTCAEVNVMWQVAEAFAKTDKTSRADDAYTYILTNCEKPEERYATMQKAMSLLPYDDVVKLFALERTGDDGKPEFEDLRNQLLRDRFAQAGQDANLVISPDDVARMQKLADDSKSADDSQLLAWYFLVRGSDEAAEEWFRKARDEGDSATISQGLALLLIKQDKSDEAEAVMYPWRNSSDEAKDTYLNAVVNMLGRTPRVAYSDEVLKRMADVVTETKSVTAAEQFGWYSNNFKQWMTGLQWFEAGLSWEPWQEPLAYGVTITLNEMNYKPGVYQMQRIWAPYSERIAWLNDPNAPVNSLDNLLATVFRLTTVKLANGKTSVSAVPIAEVNLATGEQKPIGAAAMSVTGDATAGVALTAPISAPGSAGTGSDAGSTAAESYVPDYYKYYYGQSDTGVDTHSMMVPTGNQPALQNLPSLNGQSIPKSMIATDQVTGEETVTILNTDLLLNTNPYRPSAQQVAAALYTYGQPSDKTVVWRFDDTAYRNRDFLRQYEIGTYQPQTAAKTATDTTTPVVVRTTNTLPAGSQVTIGEATVTPVAATTTTRTTTRSTSTSSASSGSCWSGRSPSGLSASAALTQGWCLMDLQRPMEAARAFEVALGSSSSKTREEAAYGQSLAYMRMGLTSKAAVAASQTPMSAERQTDLQIQILTDRAVTAYNGGHYRDALLLLDQRDQLAPTEDGLLAIRGYAYMQLQRYNDAYKVFEALAEKGDTTGMEGLALARQQLMGNAN
ncbi:hypothetical protein FJU08_05570 [Martelella alba]|uniref:Uncharacterized protein n=1 Tax=Martelella alba TaxID=2590451 RepID=A0A506UEN7_9HYPH|nr:hypothetical protein [Martelella alba]TPW32460.1 hypothetical protein FJU08_05570 [Martelella alba]